jgi:hypothetical protein
MANVTNATLRGWIKKPGRHALGRGLYFRVLGDDKAYWAFRYRVDGRVREMSLGPYPEVTLDEARDRHDAERTQVRTHKRDPLAEKRAAKQARANASAKPTFGEMADAHLRAHQDARKNERHQRQWFVALTHYLNAIKPGSPNAWTQVEAARRKTTRESPTDAADGRALAYSEYLNRIATDWMR